MDAAAAPAPPARRSRPANRRAEIARHAGELFSVRGFHAVRMDDIAEASGITARALYRHYRNKQALLAHVVREDQQHVIDTLTTLAERPAQTRDSVADLAAVTDAALDSRRLSLLWQREARHLADEDYRLVRRQTRWIAATLDELFLRHDRPDLGDDIIDIRRWVLVSIVSGHGLYDSPLPRPRLAGELIAAARRVIDAPPGVPSADPPAPVQVDRTPIARREQLIWAAARAFRDKGFGGVGNDEVGSQLGIVGPALYRYFDTKADLLVAAVNRLHEWLALEMTRAIHAPCPDEHVLAVLVRGHVRVAIEASELLAVWLTERLYLPDAARERFDRIEADYIAEWQRWLSIARPDLPDAVAASLVTTAKTVIDDCARIQRLQHYPTLHAELSRAALATLGLPAG
ncbi:TetR/AcrR family transcriptional regulator [Pseudonocardia sp.]|uniref:TetR/AcrR family transcriptional regulator n=1 Tax=Pseudonocardia sp. TaxID=60912 RepID=UPI002605443E|nr:TetR/AcrR family transcriptional regulator [Pseudonocardia sp.]